MSLIMTPKYLEAEEDDDLFTLFTKKYYHPFLVRNSRLILLGWLCVFAVTIVYGPPFLSATKSDLDIPKNSPSAKAITAFNDYYPKTSQWSPIFVVLNSKTTASIVGSFSKAIDAELTTFVSKNNIISSKTSYYDLISSPYTAFLSPRALSSNNLTMIFMINYKTEATLNQISQNAQDLLDWAKNKNTDAVYVGVTGLQPLFTELTTAATNNFETIDAVVLPIAILILGYNIRSWRHMCIVLVNLICAFLLAFSLLLPIAQNRSINPFSPTIMLSLGIAICFDYSLFMLSRFREEVVINLRSKEEAVMHATASAGHVVVLSGVTLFFTFALLTAFPQGFLSSVGFGCGAIVLTSILSNLTVTPCMLLYYDCFMVFEAFPTFSSCCCCFLSKQKQKQLPPGEVQLTSVNQQQALTSETLTVINDASRVEVAETSEVHVTNMDQARKTDLLTHTEKSQSGEGKEGNTDESMLLSKQETDEEKRTRLELLLADNSLDTELRMAVEMELAALSSSAVKTGGVPITQKKQVWFYIAFRITQWPLVTLAACTIVTVPFVLQFLNMHATSDNNEVYLRGSTSVKSLKLLSSQFPIGSVDPYQIVCTTNSTVLSNSYFKSENALVHQLLSKDPNSYMDKKTSVTALSYINGADVSYGTAMRYFTPGSTSYNSSMGYQYRTIASGLFNDAKTASLITIQTIVDPDADAIVPFILFVRNIMAIQASTTNGTSIGMNTYLFGGYTSSYDLQIALYQLVPIMILSTVLVVLVLVASNFGSIFIPIRLAATVFVSLSWTYGLTVLVYQPGAGQNAFKKLTPDALADSSGIYWIIPIMAFSVLVGLALDYDIFLMARVVEFRKLGWSDRAAICLAVEKTGNIITAAGLIMSISFAGLLIPQTVVLNQYGFILFIGVAIDTFIIRTLVVPAVFVLLDKSLQALIMVMMCQGISPPTAALPDADAEASSPTLPVIDTVSDAKSSRWDPKTIASNVNWWPTLMPAKVLSDQEEDEALLLGFSNPADYLAAKQSSAAAVPIPGVEPHVLEIQTTY